MSKVKILTDKLKDKLQEHVIMRDHTTMKVGGVADYYYEAKTIDELVKGVKAAWEAEIPYLILGGGSNIVVSDYGFPGIVIKNSTNNVAFTKENSQVIVDSGVTLSKLILDSTSQDFSALEFLFGVPGTVGGAVYGNAGAYGQAIGDFVKFVTVLIPSEDIDGEKKEPKIAQFKSDWMGFSYRSSKLKRMTGKNKPVILSIKFQLAQNRQEEIMRRLNSYKEKRWSTQPVGLTAGCVFKNPIPKELVDVSTGMSANMPVLPKERTAGYMLEKAGAKKLKVGGARVSNKHANFVMNSNSAKAQEVRQLIEDMRASVKNKFDITLEEEIEFVGQW